MIKRLLKKIFNKKLAETKLLLTEDEFYEKLFIDNGSWNSKTPNIDESKRWQQIENFLTKVRGSQQTYKMLDLGCGRGWLVNLLSKFGDVIGVEPVDKVIDYAQTLFPKLQFIKGSTKEILDLGMASSFDFIVSTEVIEHIPNSMKNEFVQEIYTLLKKEGHCVITTPRKEIQEDWNKFTASNQPIEEWMSEEELRDLFENNSFKYLDISRIALKQKKTGEFFDVYQVVLFKKV